MRLLVFALAMCALLTITAAFSYGIASNKSPQRLWAIATVLSFVCAVVELL